MIWTRRRFLLGALVGLAGCARRPASPAAAAEEFSVDRALAAAVRFLRDCQSGDGGWRSDVYGTFKDGIALTPLAVRALQCTGREEARPAIGKGMAFLHGLTRPDGSIAAPSYGLDYPLYTAALTLVCLRAQGESGGAGTGASWLSFLRQRQLTEELGWQPADKEYGGWGYSRAVPRKPQPGKIDQPLLESNLSATLFALEGLRAAGVARADPARQKAITFVKRCHNWAEDPAQQDPTYDDGGFFFIYDDPVRNKAGVAGTDRFGRQRFHSYGSTTADGLRALLLCGLSPDAPRARAAGRWLMKHFRADTHPGPYSAPHEPNREAVYYYYAASVAQAFRELKVTTAQTEQGPVAWAEALAEALIQRQQPDGSWQNPVELVRENEPIVATSFATIALAACRDGGG